MIRLLDPETFYVKVELPVEVASEAKKFRLPVHWPQAFLTDWWQKSVAFYDLAPKWSAVEGYDLAVDPPWVCVLVDLEEAPSDEDWMLYKFKYDISKSPHRITHW